MANEAFCLTLAAMCGLRTSEVSTGRAGARAFLLVRRYDRFEQNGRWRRRRQEDFCQALGKPPEAKYENNQTGIAGPSAVDMLSLTRRIMSAADLLALLDQLIFNILVCNTDAHAKNYSILIDARGPRIAPIYDVVCTQVWPNITRNLAQGVAGQRRGDHIKRRHWRRLADSVGLAPTRTVKRVMDLATLTLSKTDAARAAVAAMPAGDHTMLDEVVKLVEDRCRRILTGLDEDDETASPDAG